MSETKERQLVIGYSCNSKKQLSFFQPFGDYVTRKGHILIELQLNDIHLAPNCDIVIVKRTDDMAAAFQGDTVASFRLSLLQKFLQSQSHALIIDNMEAVWSVISRKGLLEKIDEIITAVNISQPPFPTYSLSRLWWMQVTKDTNFSHSIPFPIVVKSLPACGVHKSHLMYIIKNKEALEEIWNTCLAKEETVIAQRLVSSRYIWKVYVIGDNVDIFCQPNLALFHIKRELFERQGWICFDSQQSFPETNGTIPDTDETFALRHSIQQSIPTISQVLGLSLYGLDIVLDETNRCYSIVDVNYFPSFRGVENCFDKLWTMLSNMRRQTNSISS